VTPDASATWGCKRSSGGLRPDAGPDQADLEFRSEAPQQSGCAAGARPWLVLVEPLTKVVMVGGRVFARGYEVGAQVRGQLGRHGS